MSVIARTPLPGDSGWDYLRLDATRHHLFVSHGDRVQVLDTHTMHLIGTIDHLHHVHGIALAQDLHRGFISNGGSNEVTEFNLDTLKKVATIGGTGADPDAIVYDPGSHLVFTLNGHAGTASVISPKAGKVIGSITLPGSPEFAVSDGKGHLYVNIEDKSELAQIDVATSRVTGTWSLAPCQSPSGLAIDRTHRRLFSVCQNQVMAISDADAGKVIATAVIGNGPDAVRFDPANAMVYSANGGSGTITAVQEDNTDNYTVQATIKTQRSARTEALDAAGQRLYLSAAEEAPGKNAQGRHTMKPGSFTVLTVGTAQ